MFLFSLPPPFPSLSLVPSLALGFPHLNLNLCVKFLKIFNSVILMKPITSQKPISHSCITIFHSEIVVPIFVSIYIRNTCIWFSFLWQIGILPFSIPLPIPTSQFPNCNSSHANEIPSFIFHRYLQFYSAFLSLQSLFEYSYIARSVNPIFIPLVEGR